MASLTPRYGVPLPPIPIRGLGAFCLWKTLGSRGGGMGALLRLPKGLSTEPFTKEDPASGRCVERPLVLRARKDARDSATRPLWPSALVFSTAGISDGWLAGAVIVAEKTSKGSLDCLMIVGEAGDECERGLG